MDSREICIDGAKIHYQICGTGPHYLLLIHGAVGSINDFAIQMANQELGLDRKEFTLVAYDMPGFGRSDLIYQVKPDPTEEYFELCARVGAKLMAQLGAKTYSLAGWSDGARVAALLAIQHQSRVNSLILWGFLSHLDQSSSDAIAKTRDISTWNPNVLNQYSSMYGEQEFSEMWHHYVDFVVAALESPKQFDIRDKLCKIKCPCLILHGSDDPLVNYQLHVKPLSMQIYDSDIKQLPGLAHNLHQADPVAFNRELTNFVSSVPV